MAHRFVLLVVASLSLSAWGAGASIPLGDRLLLDVLADYEAAGFEFLYSGELVRRDTRLNYEPKRNEPIARLRKSLQQVGLTLKDSRDSKVWRIVRFEPRTRFLDGRITDATTGVALAGVRVEIAGVVVLTDDDGMFRIAIDDPRSLSVSRDGYVAKTVAAALTWEEALEIPLTREPSIEEVLVVTSRYELQKHGKIARRTLDADELNAIPELGDDAMRAANHLPGMATVGLSAKPYIRGGLKDEMLVLFNNVELLEPFHLKDFQSVFSGLNPSLIKSIDVYTGGFPARYGDRMSGVMDIYPDNDPPQLGGEVTLSLLTAGAAGYGTIAGGRGEWALSGRRGNLDIVTEAIHPTLGTPRYSDWYGRVSWELDPSTELELGVIVYNDDIEFMDVEDDGSEGELAHSRYRNAYGWVQLHRNWTRNVASTTLLSVGSIHHERDGFIRDDELDEGNSSVDDARAFEVWSLAHQMYLEVSDDLTVELGARINYQTGRYDYRATIERGEVAEFLGLPTTIDRDIRVRPRGESGGAYASARYRPWKAVTLETGLRWDFQNFADSGAENQLSPRLSAKFDLGPDTEFRLAAGRFHQAEGIHELQVIDGLDRFEDAQHADHYIAGFTHEFADTGLGVRIEAFYKRFGDTKRRFENAFNPLVLLPELASDRIEIAPSRAQARGVEITVRYRPDNHLNAWLSYTRSSAEDRVDERWIARSWDQEDTVSSGVIWSRGPWSASATLLWHSGWQTTYLPPYIGPDEVPTLTRNSDRLPHFASLDARLSRTWEWSEQSLTVFVEVINLLGRDNVGAIEYELEEDEDSGGFDITQEPETLLPLVPSIGFQWKFR